MTGAPTALHDEAVAAGPAQRAAGGGRDLSPYVKAGPDGAERLNFIVEGVHCGGCVAKIERALNAEPDVEQARVNLSTRRLALTWRGPAARANTLAETVEGLGYKLFPYDPARLGDETRREEKRLLRAMAVAGFAAANVMLLSVSIWAGNAEGMTAETRTLFHWFSALIALPAIAYAGQPFFASALSALAKRRTNMDVPISLAVTLAAAMSLWETINGGRHAYFDSAVTLLFFLLLGRFLDRRARGRARASAERLLALNAGAVTVLGADGTPHVVAPDQVAEGATVLTAAGERIAVDGVVAEGVSTLDTSLITGEPIPRPIAPGDKVFAGMINQGAPLRLTVTATGEDTLLAEIVRLMEAAEQRKARYVALADRAARLYAPAVHGLALATFLGWMLIGGLAWQTSLLYAIAVLIITCPCALGLAVPAVQVIASGRLMRQGTLLKAGDALERAIGIDTVVFDKTGTLTLGQPELANADAVDPVALELAARLAGASNHPLSRAIVRAAPGVPVASGVVEEPGRGLRLESPDGEIRLGSAAFAVPAPEDRANATPPARENPPAEARSVQEGMELWLARPGAAPVRFVFEDALRPDAADTVAALRTRGIEVRMLSGDRPAAAEALAGRLGIEQWRGGCTPADKIAAIEALAADGAKVHDGRRRPQRRPGARRRQRLGLAVDRRRHQPERRRHRLPGRQAGADPRHPRHRASGRPPGPPEFRHGDRLQPRHHPDRHGRAGDAADRRGVHVGLVDRRGRQRPAPVALQVPARHVSPGPRGNDRGTVVSVLIYLIPIALFLGLLGLGAFLWSLKTGQYEDLDGASQRILFDDDDDSDAKR